MTVVAWLLLILAVIFACGTAVTVTEYRRAYARKYSDLAPDVWMSKPDPDTDIEASRRIARNVSAICLTLFAAWGVVSRPVGSPLGQTVSLTSKKRQPYRVDLSPAAMRQLRKLPPGDAARLRGPILALAIEPRPPGARPLVDSDWWRLRAGDLRIVYAIEYSKRLVVLLRVARRNESTYRREATHSHDVDNI